ncbi:TraM recognition domain-containing protein [Burkholderia sp. BCC0097]|uniref:TraM recognition domain-containing protein n=1 Tax=Burkholderia sp. BCC0097 TaxID=2676289 RepID=UPI0015894110|nr:TraM recognition domain-containing protein [Burkholderia sp. BCC0097]
MKTIALAVLKMLGVPRAQPPKAVEPQPVQPAAPLAEDRALAPFVVPTEIDLTKPLAGQVLLAYTKPGSADGKAPPVELLLTFRDATTSVAVLGGTGTGKTTGAGIPLLKRLHDARVAMLVTDVVKGDYANVCRRLDRTVILGPASDTMPCNLLAGWSDQKLRDFLTLYSSKVKGGEAYWGSEGVTDAVLIARFIRHVERREPTLADLFHYLNEPLKFVARYKLAHRFQALYTTQEQRDAAEDTLAALRSRETGAYVFSMLHFAKDPSAKKGKTTDIITQVGSAPPTKVSMVTTDDAKIFEQYAWHVASLLTITRPFYENPKLRRAFCADVATGIDWFDLVYVQQQFIVLEMPTHTYGEAALFVAEILRMQYHDVIRASQDFRDALVVDGKRLVYGVDRFTGELHDEFQKILTADGSSMDDSNWIDISRGYGHINIVLTQSITSLHGKAKNHFAVEAFVQNCCNVVCLPTIDERTLHYVETLAGRAATTVREHLVTRTGREAFVYFASASMNGGDTWSGLVEIGTSRFPHMRYTVMQEIMARPTLMRAASAAPVAPIEETRVPQSTDEITGRVFCVTTAAINSDGFLDFKKRLTRGGHTITDTVRMKAAKEGIDASGHLAEALDRLDALYPNKGDIVAVVRGGGDVKNGQFDTYNAPESVAALEALRERGVFVVVGVGHSANDDWAIHRACDHVCDVPYHAGEVVAHLLDNLRSASNEADVVLARVGGITLTKGVASDTPEPQPKPLVKPVADDQADASTESGPATAAVEELIDPPWDPLPRVGAVQNVRPAVQPDPFDEPGTPSVASPLAARAAAAPSASAESPRALAPAKVKKPSWYAGVGSRDDQDIQRIISELDDPVDGND